MQGILFSDLRKNMSYLFQPYPPAGQAVTFSQQLEKVTRPMYRAAAAEG